MSLRTNRGLLNEWVYARWCYIKAGVYSMFTFQQILVWYVGDTMAMIYVGDKLFYSYGDNHDLY